MICPFAKQEPSPNHGGKMTGHVGCVIHVTAGESDPSGWFDSPASQVSAHYGIGNGQGGFADGQLVQYVDDDLQSWAEMAGNASYVSVETEGEPTDPLTTNQILTFARLYAWLHEERGFPFLVIDVPGSAGLITHGDGGAAWGGHTDCPGPARSSQRAEILYLAALSLQPVPVTSGGVVNMQCEDPITQGIWTIGTDGHVEAEGGAPFLGGINGNRFGALSLGPIAGFSPRKDGNGQIGYDIAIALSKPNADGTWFDHYVMPRSGSLVGVHEDPEVDLANARSELATARLLYGSPLEK